MVENRCSHRTFFSHVKEHQSIDMAIMELQALAVNPHDNTTQIINLPTYYDEEGRSMVTESVAVAALGGIDVLYPINVKVEYLPLLPLALISISNSSEYEWPGFTILGAHTYPEGCTFPKQGKVLVIKVKTDCEMVSLHGDDADILRENIQWHPNTYAPKPNCDISPE